MFWRPGCLFCSSLFRDLDRAAIPYGASNIWEDVAAAAAVREVAGGNETVPTVQIGDLFLVNPTLNQVLAAAHELDPSTLPAAEQFSWGAALRLLTGRQR